MANVIKIKRSDVASKVPLITDLELGELAMNTTDGKLFMKKQVDGVDTVVIIGPTPANNTIRSGDTFPSEVSPSELFFRTDLNALYLHDNATWSQVGVQQIILDHIADTSHHVTQGQKTLLDGLTSDITATQINYLGGVNSSIQVQLDNRVARTGDSMTGALVLPGKPNTANQAANKQYVDDSDYLNNNPKVGLTSGDSKVPVYSDFKFGLGTPSSATLTMVDRDSKQVVFFNATTPTNKISAFRAYRFSESDSFVFDNDPVSATFLNENERVAAILNLGTNFAVLHLQNPTIPRTTRIVIVKTGGSSRWQDWVFAYNVFPLYSTASGDIYSNWSLVQDAVNGDRILELMVFQQPAVSVNCSIDLNVYDSNLTKVRTQRVYDGAVDASPLDLTDQGRVGGSLVAGYVPYLNLVPGCAPAFTWNPKTETIHQKLSSYATLRYPTGIVAGQSSSFSIAWAIPRTWITTGVGIPTNLIPLKSSGYRYHTYSDITWDTDDGGMAGYGAGVASSITTDEYTGEMFLSEHGTWTVTSIGSTDRLKAGKIYKTFGSNIAYNGNVISAFGAAIPDGSAWSKLILPSITQTIGNQVSFFGTSNTYGAAQVITTTFDPTIFSTAFVANDTFKIDAANAVIGANRNWPTVMSDRLSLGYYGEFGTVVVGSTPTVYWASPGYPIYIASANNQTRTYASTGIIIPAIPNTIDGVTGLVYKGCIAWSGNTIAWAIVANTTKHYVVKLSGGVWTIAGVSIFDAQIDSGKAARGDMNNNCALSGSSSLLTANGKWLVDFDIPNTGGNAQYVSSFDTTNNIMLVNAAGKFAPINAGRPGGYDSFNGYGGSGYGYSTMLGYYVARGVASSSSIFFLSSKKPGNAIEYTEDQWYDNAGQRYETFISSEASTGLVAYLVEYPIFLGGYYTKIPNTTLPLAPNAANYVFATKTANDRSTVTVTTSTTDMPNSFARMKIATITTNATDIVTSDVFAFDGIGLPSQSGNAGKSLKTDGAVIYWGNELPSNKTTSATIQLTIADHNGIINITDGDIQLPTTMPGGFEVTIVVGGTGNASGSVTLVPLSGAGLYWMDGAGGQAGLRSISPGGWAILRKIDAPIYGPNISVWMVFGQGLS